MILESFEFLLKNKKIAQGYLIKSYWKNYLRFCIRCRVKIYWVRRYRYHCSQCGYEFLKMVICSSRVKLRPMELILEVGEREKNMAKNKVHVFGILKRNR